MQILRWVYSMGHPTTFIFPQADQFLIHSAAADGVFSVSFHHVHVASHRLSVTQPADNILYAPKDHRPWEWQAQTIHWVLRYTGLLILSMMIIIWKLA